MGRNSNVIAWSFKSVTESSFSEIAPLIKSLYVMSQNSVIYFERHEITSFFLIETSKIISFVVKNKW
jgi:hypothetical protein